MTEYRVVPERRVLEEWKREGLTQQEMADRVNREHNTNITRQAIERAMRRSGMPKQKDRHSNLLPWTLGTKHANYYVAKQLRRLAAMERGTTINADDASRARAWLEKVVRPRPEADAPYGCVYMYEPETEEVFIPVPATLEERKRGALIRVSDDALVDSQTV